MIRTVPTLIAVAVAATCISCSDALPDDPRSGDVAAPGTSTSIRTVITASTGRNGTGTVTRPTPGPVPTTPSGTGPTTNPVPGGTGPSSTGPSGPSQSSEVSSDGFDETAPLTMRPTPKTAADPQFTPITDPPAPSAGELPTNATSGQVAAAFAAGYYYRDANGEPYDWTAQVAGSASPGLIAQLRPAASDWQLPPGIQSAKVRLIEQRGGSRPTADRIALIVHSDVSLVSPAGRVSDEANGLLLNIELTRTSAGWKVSKLLGQAS